MHELAVVEDVLETVLAAAHGARVLRVRLEIGMLSAVVPDALRFAWEVATEGTLAARAVLELTSRPGKGSCRACGAEVVGESWPAGCAACDGWDVEWREGEAVHVRGLEVEDVRDLRV